MFISGVIITAVEFIAGIALNIGLGFGDMPMNFMVSEICMTYFGLWQFLSVVGIIIDDYVRWIVFKEDKLRYKLI